MTAPTDGWVDVCDPKLIRRGAGVAALVDGHQVAVFRSDAGDLYALDNHDPFTNANVMSRGIVGAHNGIPTVASPLRKQRYDLRTGECLDDEDVMLTSHELSEAEGRIQVRLSATVASTAV